MRTVGIGAKTEKSTVVAELEAEIRMVRKANKAAQDRIGDLETMLNESREEAAGLQRQLEESSEEAAGLQRQLEESRGEAAELQAKLNENQQTKSGREKKGV